MAKTAVVISIVAQQDNLGDIEIRSVLLDWIASCSVRIMGYRGSMSDGYMEPFMAHPSVQWYRGQWRLQTALATSVLQGREVHLFIAPGPQVFSSRLADTTKGVLNLANGYLVRVSGGACHIVGRAFRGVGLSKLPAQALARLSATAAVRDLMSQDVLGEAVQVYPDLAFYPERWNEREKRYVTFCIREVEGICDYSFDQAVTAAKKMDLEPIFVVQVKRDNAMAVRIAGRLGVRVVAWESQSHVAQLRRVEQVYAQSAIVVSNRLHGLIMGARAGAVPIAITADGDTKLLPTLSVCLAGTISIGARQIGSGSLEAWCGYFHACCRDTARHQLRQDIAAARKRLVELRCAVVNQLQTSKAS